MATVGLVSLLSFIVHLTGTLAYSTRVSGVLSGKLSLSISLSNILSIISRSAGVLIIPLLSGKIEAALVSNTISNSISNDYILILLFATGGTVTGIFLLERFIKLLYYTVNQYRAGDNIGLLFLRVGSGIWKRADIIIPVEKVRASATELKYLALNMLITAIYTSATLAAIYSAYIVPQYRITSLSFSFIINGFATFLFVTIIDPYISSLTDQAMADKIHLPAFYYRMRRFMYARFAGVILSFFTFNLFVFIIVKCIGFIK